MSDPTAVTGAVPTNRIRSGVINEPPPMPVIPTRKPTPRPKRMTTGSTLVLGSGGARRPALLLGLDQDVGNLGTRELLRRPLARAQHLPHLRPREEDAILGAGGARPPGRHTLRDLAVEGVLEPERLDFELL